MKNVIITGVSGGIGKAVAERLIEEGSSVIGLDRTVRDEIKQVAETHPDQLFLYEADLMDVEKLGDLIKKLVAEHGPIGGFVHCAGFDKMAPLHLTKIEDIENLWRLHALVPMVMIAAISKKKNHDEGTSIVLITSQSAHEGAMGHTAYAAAKGAIEGYLAPAAAEVDGEGDKNQRSVLCTG
jgi:Short-chain dehydrogenases of various substrate specificities